MISLDKEIEEFINFSYKNGIDLYLVGGCVRDYLLGIKNYDIDIALTSDYKEAVRVLKSRYKCRVYNKYQAIKINLGKYQIEISHCRKESDYHDYRHPSKIEFIEDIREDSYRRDFTINALYYKDGNIYDFHNGMIDLKNKELHFIGDTKKRINEDAIRILRMIRFASLGYKITDTDKKILINNKDLLKNLSEDEYNKEYLKIKKINNQEIIKEYQIILKSGDTDEDNIQDFYKRL